MENFEIIKSLGTGAFGSVSLVRRKLNNKTYAMKIVKISKLSYKERENALNEIRLLASLRHQNIIGYKEAFYETTNQTLNIVMEFADDGDISTKIKNNIKKKLFFSEETIWNWIIQILEGIKYLHQNKIMHRDLKSANVFLLKNGIIKLGDLNVSKLTQFGFAFTHTGTPYYSAPEIWKEQPYDYKCDIWSIGVILYELCTLKVPFRGTNLKDLVKNINLGKYNKINSSYSKELSDLLKLMLTVDPNKRKSAEQLLELDYVKKRNIFFNNERKEGKCILMKTIKMPFNMKDINRKLPKKRYNDEMKENDEYETLKDTMRLGGFLKGVNLFNNNYVNNDNNNDNNNNNVKYDKINVINKPIIMNKKKNALEDLYDKVFNNQNQKNYYNYYNNNNMMNNKNNFNNNNNFDNRNQ